MILTLIIFCYHLQSFKLSNIFLVLTFLAYPGGACTVMSQLREFVGKGWHDWPTVGDTEDVSLASSPSHSDLASGDITPSSSRASSPPPHLFPKDDVTKLPRKDMRMFGQCPVQVFKKTSICLAICIRKLHLYVLNLGMVLIRNIFHPKSVTILLNNFGSY